MNRVYLISFVQLQFIQMNLLLYFPKPAVCNLSFFNFIFLISTDERSL